MGQASETITVFGGTGFLGRRAARRLAARGFRVRAASRHPGRAQPLFRGGETSVTEIEADIRDERQIVPAQTGRLGYALRVSPNHYDDPLTRPVTSLLKWG